MTVKELIEILNRLPPEHDVYMDVTTDTDGILHYKSVDIVDEVETDVAGTFIVFSNDDKPERFNINPN